MSLESRRFLAKAQRMLDDAAAMLSIGLAEQTGRTAYLAAFHAAQAFLVVRAGRAMKTHRGVRSEFSRITRDDARIPPTLRSFLAEAFALKSVSDYETDESPAITVDDAGEALEQARHFVTTLRLILEDADDA